MSYATRVLNLVHCPSLVKFNFPLLIFHLDSTLIGCVSSCAEGVPVFLR